MRCRDDLRRARTAARHRVSKQLLRHGRIYRDGKSQWTKMHRAWIARQRLDDDARAQGARARCSFTSTGWIASSTRSTAISSTIARGERWAPTVEILTRFRGIATRTALGLIAEIGDFAASPIRASCAPGSGSSPPSTPPVSSAIAGTSPRPATTTPAGSWSRPPGPTSTGRAAPTAGPSPTRALGKPRSGCTPLPASHHRTRETLDGRDGRGRPRARLLPVGCRYRPALRHREARRPEAAAA